MGNFKRTLGVVTFLQMICSVPTLAQEYQGYTGVFEGFSGTQAVVRTDAQEAYWLVDQNTRFSAGRPFPGDWVRVEVDPYNRAVYFAVEEHAERRAATVDHLEGLVVVVRTDHGIEMWNDVPTTWHIGVVPGGLQSGDSIDVGVFHNGNLAYLRLDSHGPFPLSPPDMGGPVDSSYAVQMQSAPPPLPDYVVPPCPEPDYIWTPGYWQSGPSGYYWVPGVWVAPPAPGLLWTPGYWVFVNGNYIFRAGYWGAHVGYYGGVVYGAGYYGEGYVGARWEGGHVAYNTAAVPVNTTIIHNTYVNNTVVINNQTTTISKVVSGSRNTQYASFSGPGGARATPTASERRWANETHVNPTTVQLEHTQAARANPQLNYSVNHGKPAVPAATRPMTTPHMIGPANKGLNPGSGGNIPSGHPQVQQHERPHPGIPVESKYPPNAQANPLPGSKPSPEPHPQAKAHPQTKKKKTEEKKNGENRENNAH